jgi:hypothetical protein
MAAGLERALTPGAAGNACHVWCAGTCLLQNLSDCTHCCGAAAYYTGGLVDIMLYR